MSFVKVKDATRILWENRETNFSYEYAVEADSLPPPENPRNIQILQETP